MRLEVVAMAAGDAELISEIYDAALEPGRWMAVVQSLMRAFDVDGGAYLVIDKLTGDVRWISMAGPCNALRDEYVEHFAVQDPYARALRMEPIGRWTRVQESVTGEQRRTEWYNDFFMGCGMADMVGTRLFEDGRWIALFGLHEVRGTASIPPDAFDRRRPVFDALRKAAKLHHDLDHMGWKSTVASRVLEQVAIGVIIADGNGHLIECNAAAERILGLDDGILVRWGQLKTPRVFETSKLAKMIAAAAARQGESDADHMLVARNGGGAPYAVTVAPLSAGLSAYQQPLAMVLITNPDERRPSQKTLVELFGFSPAESNLAAALMRGHKLDRIARDRGVRITTVRTQLSSMLKKTGTERQADLIRILAGAQLVESPRRMV
jgi:PAS domain-containing protein/DNA-binding CsgD family transcriptional regulator